MFISLLKKFNKFFQIILNHLVHKIGYIGTKNILFYKNNSTVTSFNSWKTMTLKRFFFFNILNNGSFKQHFQNLLDYLHIKFYWVVPFLRQTFTFEFYIYYLYFSIIFFKKIISVFLKILGEFKTQTLFLWFIMNIFLVLSLKISLEFFLEYFISMFFFFIWFFSGKVLLSVKLLAKFLKKNMYKEFLIKFFSNTFLKVINHNLITFMPKVLASSLVCYDNSFINYYFFLMFSQVNVFEQLPYVIFFLIVFVLLFVILSISCIVINPLDTYYLGLKKALKELLGLTLVLGRYHLMIEKTWFEKPPRPPWKRKKRKKPLKASERLQELQENSEEEQALNLNCIMDGDPVNFEKPYGNLVPLDYPTKPSPYHIACEEAKALELARESFDLADHLLKESISSNCMNHRGLAYRVLYYSFYPLVDFVVSIFE